MKQNNVRWVFLLLLLPLVAIADDKAAAIDKITELFTAWTATGLGAFAIEVFRRYKRTAKAQSFAWDLQRILTGIGNIFLALGRAAGAIAAWLDKALPQRRKDTDA